MAPLVRLISSRIAIAPKNTWTSASVSSTTKACGWALQSKERRNPDRIALLPSLSCYLKDITPLTVRDAKVGAGRCSWSSAYDFNMNLACTRFFPAGCPLGHEHETMLCQKHSPLRRNYRSIDNGQFLPISS